MRICHLIHWPAPGGAPRSGASAAAEVASAQIARRPEDEHLVIVLGPSAARRWAPGAGLPGPVCQIAPPTGQVAMAGPALARALRAAAPVDVVQAWSLGAAAVARRVRPTGVRVCAAALATGPRARRWLRAAPAIDTLVTPCTQTAAEAGRAGAAARIIETGLPRPSAIARAAGAGRGSARRSAARRDLALGPDDRVALLVGDGADASRFMIASSLTAASGRRVCAVLPGGAGSSRRALRTFEQSKGLLDCRMSPEPWTQLAAAADIGMIIEDGDIAVGVALAVAMGLGLPVIAPAAVYERLGVRRADAPELVGAAWTRAELARLAGPLVDDAGLAQQALGRALAAAGSAGGAGGAGAGGRDFFDALDEAWGDGASSIGGGAALQTAHTMQA